MNLFSGKLLACAAIAATLSFMPALLQAGGDTSRQIDSLRSSLSSIQDKETEMKIYSQLNRLYNQSGDYHAYLEFLNGYIDRTRTLASPGDEVKALRDKASMFFNYSERDSLLAVLPGYLKIFRKYGEWYTYFYVSDLAVLQYLGEADYDRALALLQENYDFARRNKLHAGEAWTLNGMAKVYQYTDKYELAEKTCSEALELLKKHPDDRYFLEIYYNFTNVLRHSQNYKRNLEVAAEWEKQLISMSEDGKKHTGNLYSWFMLYTNYVRTYIALDQPQKAEKYLDEAQTLPVAAVGRNPDVLDDLRWRIYYTEGRYKEALAVIDTLYTPSADTESSTAYGILWDKAEVAYQDKQFALAADSYKQAIELNERITSKQSEEALDELRTRYEVDKLEAQKRAARNYLLAALGGCALLALLLLVWIFYTRKVKAKNRGLVRRLEEQDRLAAELERKEEELRKLRMVSGPGQPAAEKDAYAELYEKLRELMRNPEVYTDPAVNRKRVAEMLGTNEKYLHEAIRKHAGATFTEYINALRLHYARQLLVDTTEKYTVETVAIICGIDSRSTFHRLFRESYGLTPDEFRRNSQEKPA